MRRARHHCVDGRRLCCALRPQVGFRARSEKGLPEADVPALRGSPLSKGTEDVGVTQSFSLEFRPRYHSSKVSEAFPVREPDKKIDMIARSVGIVFALSVLLFLRPFSAQGQTTTPERKPFTPSPINACAMLASQLVMDTRKNGPDFAVWRTLTTAKRPSNTCKARLTNPFRASPATVHDRQISVAAHSHHSSSVLQAEARHAPLLLWSSDPRSGHSTPTMERQQWVKSADFASLPASPVWE